MLIVAKFGGTSLSCASQFEKVKDIVCADANRRVVVVSALGKRQPTDNKLTDLFYSIFENRSQSAYYNELWQEVISRFVAVKHELKLAYDVAGELKKIQDGLAARHLTLDYLVSRGEYLTARLMSEYLDYDFYDAKDLIIFDANGDVDLKSSYERIATAIPTDRNVIIPGFYGADRFGDIKLFSRGGSDITGALIAAGLGADKYENFTDVPGVLMVDPRIVANPMPIPELTYDEMSEIALMGAEVLHRKSVAPVKLADIPVNIKNTNAPDAPGTLITCCSTKTSGLIGIFGKKDYTFLTISQPGLPVEKMRQFFEGYGIKIEHLRIVGHCAQIMVATVDIKYRFEQIANDLQSQFGIKDIKTQENFALIKIFDRGIISEPTFLEVDYSPLENGLIAVSNDDYERTIQALYKGLLT